MKDDTKYQAMLAALGKAAGALSDALAEIAELDFPKERAFANIQAAKVACDELGAALGPDAPSYTSVYCYNLGEIAVKWTFSYEPATRRLNDQC